MKKQMCNEEKRLQKKLIPLNIIVCIISLIAAISMFFAPIIKVDAGKLLRSDAVIDKVEEIVDDGVGSGLEGTDQEGIDYAPVVAGIVRNVFGKAEGEISVTAFGAAKVAFSGGENKGDKVLDEMFLGEGKLVDRLIDSVVDGVSEIFQSPEGKALIEETIVLTLTKSLVKDGGEISDEQIKDLTEEFRKIEAIENGDTGEFADGFIDLVQETFPDALDINEDSRAELKEEIQKIYSNAASQIDVAGGEKVTIENIICVQVSESGMIDDLNLSDLLGKLFGDENPDGASKANAVADAENPDGGGSRVVCKTYDELLVQMGLDEETTDELKTKLGETLRKTINESSGGVSEYLGYYGYVFYAMLIFIVPWLILFLFSFFHLLAKNKRFMTWYVKIVGFIPALIWLALTLAPILLDKFFSSLLEGEQGPFIKAALGSVSTYFWIEGICYVLLWLLSLCYAFPVKHKIRKLKKGIKKGTVYVTYDDFGGKNKKKKGKAAAPAAYGYGNSRLDGTGYDAGNPYGYAPPSDAGYGYGGDYVPDYSSPDTGFDSGFDTGFDTGFDSGFDSGFDTGFGSDYGTDYKSFFDDDDDI